MAEPASTTAAGAVGWKLIGGMAGAYGIGAALAAIVVLCMTPPRSPREWTVGLISTVIGSLAGGAFVIEHYQLQTFMHSFSGLLSVLGIAFSCGLPAWAIVRAVFTYIHKQDGRDIVEVAKDIKQQIGG